MAASGHEDAFPRPRLSARCRFRQGTFAGTWGNGVTRQKPPPPPPPPPPQADIRSTKTAWTATGY